MLPRLRPEPIDTVLFDFDGTLMDASSAICAAFRAALGEGTRIDDAQIRLMIGRPLRDMFRSVHPEATDHDVDGLVERYRDVFLPLSATESHPVAGAVEAVRRLAPSKRLGIVTTRLSDGALRMLHAHGLSDAFGCVIGLEHVRHPKPDPEPVQRALEALHTAPSRAVMVGDTPEDILAGRRAGTVTVGVTTGAHDRDTLSSVGADVVLKSLSELPSLLVFHGDD